MHQSKDAPITKIIDAKLVLEDQVLEGGALALVDGRIAYAGPGDLLPDNVSPPGSTESVSLDGAEVYDAGGRLVFPGFIDVHIHGGGGADTMDATPEALERLAATHAAHGTTGLLATTMTAPFDRIREAAACVREAMELSDRPKWTGARILGMHLEGPYLNPKRAGAQDPNLMRDADLEELGDLLSVLEEGFRQATVAPERNGGEEAVRFLDRAGVIVSMGHTDATFEQAQEAFAWGVRHMTHTYNAMRPLHHRDPGTVGAALLGKNILCELIADGIHVHPDAARLLWRMQGSEGICLITDAIRATGMGEGRYELGGQPVTVKDGACRLDDGTLAGSILTMDRAVGNVITWLGISPVEAARIASLNAARQLGLGARKGSLRVGKDADVVVLNEDYEAVAVWVEGRPVARRA